MQHVATEHKVILQDDNERNAYNQFVMMIQKYRNAQWVQSQAVSEPAAVPDATGDATPAEEAQVIGHIEPELTYAEVLAKLQQYVSTHTPAEGRTLLTAFQINRLPELPKERYKEFAAACDAVLVTA